MSEPPDDDVENPPNDLSEEVEETSELIQLRVVPAQQVENPPNDFRGEKEEDDNGGENVLLFPDPAIDEQAERLEEAAELNPRRLAEEQAFLEMQRAQVISRSVAAESAQAAAQRLARRVKAGGAAVVLLFVAGLLYVVERSAAAAKAQVRADELALANMERQGGFVWQMGSRKNEFVPLPGQQQAPCVPGEKEVGGYCWHTATNVKPPCRNYVEWDGLCWAPTPGMAQDKRSADR